MSPVASINVASLDGRFLFYCYQCFRRLVDYRVLLTTAPTKGCAFIQGCAHKSVVVAVVRINCRLVGDVGAR